MTRVDANEVVDQLMSGINFSSETTEESKYRIFSRFGIENFTVIKCTSKNIKQLQLRGSVLEASSN